MAYNYETLLDNIQECVYFVDKNRTVTYWNKAAEILTGFRAEDVVGHKCSDNILIHIDEKGCNICDSQCPLADSIVDGVSREAHLFMHHKDGHRIPVFVRASQLLDDAGSVVGGAEFFHDESSRVLLEERLGELNKLAMLDNLTQLPNRNHIEPEIESRLEENRRYGMQFGVVFLDIDHFKRFNDTYGHEVGDLVLKNVAKSLMTVTRPFDLWGRWGGEEFLGVIRNIDDKMLLQIAERVRVVIGKTLVHHQDQNLSVTASLGVTLVRRADSIDAIIKRADDMLYKSKQNGRNQVSCDF